MDEKKQTLLRLLEELMIPITPEDAEESMAELNEEDIQALIDRYQKLKEYRQDLEDFARDVDPKAYAEAEATFQDELAQADEEYLDKMEKIQEDADMQLDALDAKSEREEEEGEKSYEADLDDAVQTYKEFSSELDKVAPQQAAKLKVES